MSIMDIDSHNSTAHASSAGASEHYSSLALATLRYSLGQSWLGTILAAFSDTGVAAVLIGDDAAALTQDLRTRFPNALLVNAQHGCASPMARVIAFVEAPLEGLDLPLDIRGTAFQKRVWKALQAIPGGELASYSAIATRIGMPDSAQAIVSACAANNIAIAVPCHRVVLSNGRYGGYAWGVKRKQCLIEREVQRV